MGHTSKTEPVENPHIVVQKVRDDFCVATFENSPTAGQFAAKTEEDAIENLVNWFDRRQSKMDEEAATLTDLAVAYRKCVEEVNKAKAEGRIRRQ